MEYLFKTKGVFSCLFRLELTWMSCGPTKILIDVFECEEIEDEIAT